MALAQSNRMLWSAALENADLYLPSPLSVVSSLKLAESNERRARHRDLVQTLEREVDFPDVRRLVNEGALSFSDVLVLRSKAAKFRSWLQTRAERDSDALLAYHHEVTKESGLVRGGRKVLRLFGTLGGPLAAFYAEHLGATLPQAGAVGLVALAAPHLADKGVEYIFDLAGKLDEDWKPVVFGDWAKDYLDRHASTSPDSAHNRS